VTERTPEAAYRSYWINAILWAVVFLPLAGWLAVLRNRGTKEGWTITLWATGITIAVFVALWLVYALPASRFYRRIQRENPQSLVFAATRTKSYDVAISELTEDHFNPSYFCAVVADGDSLRIVSRRGGTFKISAQRISNIEASTTRDLRVDYPCVAIDLKTEPTPITLPLRAHQGPWRSLFMSRPTVIRELVAGLNARVHVE